MFDYILSQKRDIIRNGDYRPPIFKTKNDVVVLTTDYNFDFGNADQYEADVLVASGVDMKNTKFTSDVPLNQLNSIDKLVSDNLKKSVENEKEN